MDFVQQLLNYDLRSPHPRVNIGGRWVQFKAAHTSEGLFYAPTYISPLKNRRGWKVRLNLTEPKTNKYIGDSNTPLERSLEEAWRFVIDTLMNETLRKPIARPKRLTYLDTGFSGVRLAWNKGNSDVDSLLLRVSQSLIHEKSFHVTFFSSSGDPLNRSTFDFRYRLAIAARRYYEFLRLKNYRLLKPISRSTEIPREFFIEEVPVPDLYDRMIKELSKRQKY